MSHTTAPSAQARLFLGRAGAVTLDASSVRHRLRPTPSAVRLLAYAIQRPGLPFALIAVRATEWLQRPRARRAIAAALRRAALALARNGVLHASGGHWMLPPEKLERAAIMLARMVYG